MKKTLPAFLRGLICSVALLLVHSTSFASHIVGCDLLYTWVSGNTYKVTVILYGNCGTTTGAFETLPNSVPQVCIYNGNTFWQDINLPIVAPVNGVEITPVCPADAGQTQCTNTAFSIPGIKKFTYSTTVTLPGTSRAWRFVYNGYNGAAGSAAGRATSITNLVAPGSSIMQLIDTLNNADTGIFSHSSCPDLTVIPTPFFCKSNTDCYNPGAVSAPGDSLRFALVAPTNGTGTNGGCTVGGALSYIGATAWAGQALTAATPLQNVAAPPSYGFDPATGQICFFPNVTQRSVVVYNIEQYLNDTLVGTCQREMTFVVLTCPSIPPKDTTGTFVGVDTVAGSHAKGFYACGNSGPFCITMDTLGGDTNLITYDVTGLASSMTYTVTNNGTTHPTITICGNTDSLSPGEYTFYLHMQDNACPLTGNNTVAYTIDLLPVPTLSVNVISPANCFHGEIIQILPGGTGKPWTIDVSGGGGLDTFQTYIDSMMITDTLNPNGLLPINDTISIFTSVSHECGIYVPLVITPPPPIDPRPVVVNPAYCGGQGQIILEGLFPGITDTVKYKYYGVWQTNVVGTVTVDSTITITGLLAGVYDSIIVTYGFCHSQYIGPLTLTNPPFPIRAISSVNPTDCGGHDGSITLYGLNPNQVDTIYYYLVGTGYTSFGYFVGLDSTVIIPALGAGNYIHFYARTDSICLTDSTLGTALVAPAYSVTFTSSIHYGCHGDSVYFTSINTSAVDTNDVTYHWYFGDGYTDTAINPLHIYANTETDTTFIVKQYAISAGGCIDSTFQTLNLVNYIAGSFSVTPYPYVCQNTPVNLTNTSISLGTGPNNIATTYQWTFGDGNGSGLTSPTNTYLHTGSYNITMVQTNFVPCSDTVIESIIVDTISGIQLDATDTTLCNGQQVLFTALYAGEGHVNTFWSVSDGFRMDQVNPLLHSFDGPGLYTVSVASTYRACPEVATTRTIRVFPYADLYLGPDTALCPGSNPIILSDNRNTGTPGASWLWNTGETGPQITVTKPGYYTVTVTINGCGTSDTVNVANDCYMDVPNAFTPNGDGVNDYFFPRQMLTKGMTSFNMTIYNRWGQEIYSTTNLDGRGWDGYFNGVQQQEGVYIYVIDAMFQDGQTEHHKGNVTLLR